MFEAPSRTIDAVMRLQPRCSERIERDSVDLVITTRLLVSSSRIGCIIGKGGAIIKEMRSTSRANIRIFSDENIPKVASEDDEMVQVNEFGSWHCMFARSIPVMVYISLYLFDHLISVLFSIIR